MKFTDSEWQIMTALWESNPATAREIVEKLPEKTQWAYTTVKTMLSRLVNKEAVKEKKVGNVSVYSPEISRDLARKSAVKSLLSKAFGGAIDPMLNFVITEKKISEKKRAEILKILDEAEKEE